MKAIRNLMDEIARPGPRMIILEADDVHVKMVDSEGHAVTYKTDNKKERHQLSAGTVQTQSQWQNGMLAIRFLIDHGPTVVKTYSADAEHHRLLIAVRMDDSRVNGRSVPPSRYVYTAADR
jgi:hypothetical protein